MPFNMLVKQYGPQNIEGFYAYHRQRSDNPALNELDEKLKKIPENKHIQRALLIANSKIRIKGFDNTRHYIESYIKLPNESGINHLRNTRRISFQQPMNACIFDKHEKLQSVLVLECSDDCSGLYFSTKKKYLWRNIEDNIEIDFVKCGTVRGELVHFEARHRFGEIHFGWGVKFSKDSQTQLKPIVEIAT